MFAVRSKAPGVRSCTYTQVLDSKIYSITNTGLHILPKQLVITSYAEKSTTVMKLKGKRTQVYRYSLLSVKTEYRCLFMDFMEKMANKYNMQ